MSDSNPRTTVKNTDITIEPGERMIAKLDLGVNYSRRFDQINQVKFSFMADQINNDVESRFREYKISLPYRALSKTIALSHLVILIQVMGITPISDIILLMLITQNFSDATEHF